MLSPGAKQREGGRERERGREGERERGGESCTKRASNWREVC